MINAMTLGNGVELQYAGRAQFQRDHSGRWPIPNSYGFQKVEDSGFCMYLLICEHGSADYFDARDPSSTKTLCRIGAGEGIIASPRTYIKAVHGNQWKLLGFRLWVKNPEGLSILMQPDPEADGSGNRYRIPKLDRACTRLAIPHLEEMSWEFQQRSLGWKSAIRARFDLLNVTLARCRESQKKQPYIKSACQGSVRLAQHYFYENLNRPIRLKDVAKAVGVSSKRLIALYREGGMESPMSSLRTLRMRKARELLCEGSLSIKEVAHAVGLSSSTVLGRVYKKVYRCTPKEERFCARV